MCPKPDGLTTARFISLRNMATRLAYRNLSITADFIGDNYRLKRRIINIELADKYGTWKGSGFGALYQFKQVVLTHVPANSVHRVVLWQTMSNRDTVRNINDVGVIITPSND